MVQMAPHKIRPNACIGVRVEQNPSWVHRRPAADDWAAYLDGLRSRIVRLGPIIEITARGVAREGLGAPVYMANSNRSAARWMSINAVKGVRDSANGHVPPPVLTEELNRQTEISNGRPTALSIRSKRDAGGKIPGAISTGQISCLRFASNDRRAS